MKNLLWKIRYVIEIRKLLRTPLGLSWEMACWTVEVHASDIQDGSLTPRQAAEEERDEWARCC